MKIALCFSGQPRFIKECSIDIIQNVIRNYDVDVYAHFWFDEGLQTQPYKYGGNGNWQHQRILKTAIEDFQNIYRPVKLVTEPSKSFVHSKLHFESSLHRYWKGGINNPLEPNFRERMINNTLSYFYSLNEVNKLKKINEYEKDFKYDVVIRCRTDAHIKSSLKFEDYNLNLINYSGMQNQPDGMINDWFDFGNSEVMDAFMSVFSVSELILKKCLTENNNAWCPEMMHRKMVDCFGIQYQGHPIHIVLPRF